MSRRLFINLLLLLILVPLPVPIPAPIPLPLHVPMFVPVFVFGETAGKGLSSGTSEILSAVQVPPQVYVGDRARLVLTMVPKASLGNRSIVIDVEDKLPQSKTMQISRLELEPHSKNPRIIIDFIPLEPGQITMPSFEIGPYFVSRQAVEVSSVLESGQSGPETAPLEEPLLVPGTRLLLYGALFFAVLVTVLVLALFIWGSAWYGKLQTWAQKKRMSRDLKQTLQRFEQVLTQGAYPSPGDVGNLLALLRNYLELVMGYPCVAKTGRELLAEAGGSGFPEIVIQLGNLVTLSDALRFSGKEASAMDLRQLCADSRRLLLLIEQTNKGRQKA